MRGTTEYAYKPVYPPPPPGAPPADITPSAAPVAQAGDTTLAIRQGTTLAVANTTQPDPIQAMDVALQAAGMRQLAKTTQPRDDDGNRRRGDVRGLGSEDEPPAITILQPLRAEPVAPRRPQFISGDDQPFLGDDRTPHPYTNAHSQPHVITALRLDQLADRVGLHPANWKPATSRASLFNEDERGQFAYHPAAPESWPEYAYYFGFQEQPKPYTRVTAPYEKHPFRHLGVTRISWMTSLCIQVPSYLSTTNGSSCRLRTTLTNGAHESLCVRQAMYLPTTKVSRQSTLF
jgi:hypothetical protein